MDVHRFRRKNDFDILLLFLWIKRLRTNFFLEFWIRFFHLDKIAAVLLAMDRQMSFSATKTGSPASVSFDNKNKLGNKL